MSRCTLFRSRYRLRLPFGWRVGVSLFVLSLVFLDQAPVPAAVATAKVPPARKQIDANMRQFQFLDDTQGFVLGMDQNLWLEHAMRSF
jgi:hypothetical protein